METSLTHSEPLSLKYDVALALRSASRLVCASPVAALEYPGNSKITHEPLSSSLRLMFRDGASLSARISVPPRTVVSPLTVNFLPLSESDLFEKFRTCLDAGGARISPERLFERLRNLENISARELTAIG